MKSFDRLREQSLEEKLKSSDPTGKWVSDFVHSDNPKFAGKSKKERIRMALGASYAAKRNEEVDSTDIHERVMLDPDGKPLPTKFSGNTTDPRSPDEERAHQEAKKDAEDTLRAREADIEKRNTELRKQGQTREFKLGESAWGKDKMANLKAAHDRHSEKAIAANKAGDDEATKVHQSKMNMLKNQMNKLRKEEVEQIVENPTSIKQQSGSDRAYDVTHKATGNKVGTVYTPGKTNPNHVATVHGSDGRPLKSKEFSSFRDAHNFIKSSRGIKESAQIDEAKHRVQVTVSEPDHPMVTRRKEKQQKFVRVSGDKESAVTKAQQHYKKQGYKVHGAEYVSSVNEDIEQIDELKTSTLIRYSTKANKALIGGDRNKEEKRIKGIQKAIYKVKNKNNVKEDVVAEESGMIRKITPVSVIDGPGGYEEAQKRIKDNEASSVKRQELPGNEPPPVVNKSRKAEKPTINTNEQVVGEAKIKVNFKMPSEHLSDKLARRQSELRKKTGLPDPSHYKNVSAQKKKELGEGSIEKGGENDLTGTWSSKTKKGQPDVAPPVPNDPIDKNAKDTTTIKTGLGDLNKVFDKIDKENAAKTKKPVKENFKFSDIRNNLAEAKKMKGEDPCWDDYKMIGTKMKNGKQVPNCVPKEETELEGSSIQEEDDYPHSGVGVSRDMGMAQSMARMKAQTSLMRSKHGDNFSDQKMIDHDEKTEFAPGDKPGTYRATVRVREKVPAVKEDQEYDYEGDMAMSDLRSILHNAKTVHDMLKPNTNIPEWCQSKITLAEDYISTVANYMRGEMSEEVQIDEAKPGLYANIHAKRKRIKSGSGERMRTPGAKGAPTAQAFKDSAKTAKK